MTEDPSPKQPDRQPGTMIGTGLAIGAGAGVALGVAFDNIALGIAIGMSIGIAIGAGLEQRGGVVEQNDTSRKRVLVIAALFVIIGIVVFVAIISLR